MFRRVRETAPAGLVPLAWTFATVAHLDLVAERTVLVALVVMDVLLVAFVTLSWSDMREGVLRAWRLVVLAGIPVTLAGTVGLLVSPPARTLLAASVVGWALLPAPALWYTGRASSGTATVVNDAAAALSVVGAAVYLWWLLTGSAGAVPGLVLVGVGQTAAIVDAVLRY